jgi:hypothetical protein
MDMFSLRTIAIAAAAVIALGTTAAAAPKSLTIQMKALNGSGQNGSALLTQETDGVRVLVHLDNTPKGVAEPTHIHIGTCGHINKAPEYALANTVAGTSLSTVRGITLIDLLKGKYAINVHKSAADLSHYVSCGDIR